MKKKHILSFTLKEFQKEIASLGLKNFLANQVFDWIYKKHTTDFSQMRNISKDNQRKLAEYFNIECLEQSDKQEIQGDDASVKYALQLSDKNKIEIVVLKESSYETLCVSSQVGCPLGCAFCSTGQIGFKRDLLVEEIIAQILFVFQNGHNISHLVFMGMGEPLLNYQNVFKAVEIIQGTDSFNISYRKMTISSVGIIKGLETFFQKEIPVNLALSIGHPDPLKRVVLVPVEKSNPLIEVAALVHANQKNYNRKLTLEYTLLENVNDDEYAIMELVNIAKYLKAKINLINLNPSNLISYKPVSNNKLLKIKSDIQGLNIPVTIRYSKGQNILAGCGQLGSDFS